MMAALLLNCDLGEKVHDNDALIMPLIDQANIACGLHASDPPTIAKTIKLAKTHQVEIGAHPSYPDRENFGRRSIPYSADEVIQILHYQLAAFDALCQLQQTNFTYVKPHGALYNDMMKEPALFEAVCMAISRFNPKLKLMIQAVPDMTLFYRTAQQYGLSLMGEAFADRNYQKNGLLVPRSEQHAVITDHLQVKANIEYLLATGCIKSASEHTLSLDVYSLCVHGDNAQALSLIKLLRNLIDDRS